MCRLTYRQVRDKLKMWEWELDFRYSVQDEACFIEAQKEVTRWGNMLWQFPAENIERSYAALAKGKGLIEQSKLILNK